MIVGRSPAIKRALALAERFAATRLPVLLVGATGTGKELFAQHIHQLSGRRGPFVDVNCAALPREMVESLLLGHARGAFTGAVVATRGYVRRADGGTLFLDELTSMPPEAQAKMLRFLETNEVEPLGADEKRRVDVRVVAAAQDDLSRAVGAGQLRRDLFQRLAGVVLELPLLAARVEDIAPLAEHFAASQEQCLGPGADLVLLNHSWPGNVRELRLTIERAGLIAGNGSLPASVIAEAIALGTPTAHEAFAPAQSPRQPETPDEMITVLNSFGWDPLRTAAALGIGRTSLFKRLRDLGISLRATKRGWSTAVHRLNS